jgi:hypothetical protein
MKKSIMLFAGLAFLGCISQAQTVVEHNGTQDLRLQVFNMAGQCILQDELDDKLTEIDIRSLSRGIYAIQILSIDWTIQKKLIKE